MSAMYNYTAKERKEMNEGIRDSFDLDHMIVDESHFYEKGRT